MANYMMRRWSLYLENPNNDGHFKRIARASKIANCPSHGRKIADKNTTNDKDYKDQCFSISESRFLTIFDPFLALKTTELEAIFCK